MASKMNRADQAAHAIVIAAHRMSVDPVTVLLRNVEPTPSKVYARNLAAALLSRLPDWDRRKALDALGVSTNERFLESFIQSINSGKIRWISAVGFECMLTELVEMVSGSLAPGDGASDGSTLSAGPPPVTGLLDIVYGVEEVSG